MNSKEIEMGWSVRLLPYECPECKYMFAVVGLVPRTSASLAHSESGESFGEITSQVIDYCPGCGAKLEDDNQVLEEGDDDKE